MSGVAVFLLLVLAQAGAGQADLEALLRDGAASLERGDLEAATERFSRVRREWPGAAEGFLGLSAVAAASGDPVQGLALAKRAAERAPSGIAPALAVARMQAALGRVEESLSAFAHARSLLPGGGAGAAAGTAGIAPAYLVPALLLRNLDRTGDAILLLEEAVERRFGSAEIYEQLALLLLADGAASRALAILDRAADEELGNPGLDRARGFALARDPARRDEALVYLLRALDGAVEAPLVVHLEAADILSAQARYPEALEHLRVAEALAGDDPEVYYRLGRTLAAADDSEAATVALERYRSLQRTRDEAVEAIRAAGAEMAAGLSKAQNMAATGDLQAALAPLTRLLESHPDGSQTADVHSLRGKVLFSMGRPGEAAEAAAQARQLQPDQVEHHYLEGLFLHTDGRPGEAAPALERALALDPDLGEAYALLGMIAAEDGRPTEAAERMERALALGLEGNAALRFNYARVLESLGRTDEAAAQMEAFERLRAAAPP